MNYKNLIFTSFLLFPLWLFPQRREKMLIVSPALFSTQLNGYIAAKEADNIDCRLIIVDTSENFQTIKQKIALAYTAFKADFLLLIGDYEYIPACPVAEGLSDMEYGKISENDPLPQMAVGRFSVETETHLQTMIERSLNYKNCSKTVVGIASKEQSELTQLTDFEAVQKMNKLLENNDFRIEAELFDGINANNPNYRDVVNVLNRGVTWVNYAGYGFYQGWKTSGFFNQHIDSLSNSGELPIILSAACLNGYFAQRECFAEKWLRASANGNPTGARAVIMSSDFADWDATLSGMAFMCGNLPPAETNCRLGTLYLQAYSHIAKDLKRKKEADCWLLFGDPSLWIYPPAETGVKECNGLKKNIFVYPNPAKRELRVTSYELQVAGCGLRGNEIEIYDIYGRKAPLNQPEGGKQLPYGQKLPSFGGGGGGSIVIDISHLGNGIYFLKMGNTVVKFIKE